MMNTAALPPETVLLPRATTASVAEIADGRTRAFISRLRDAARCGLLDWGGGAVSEDYYAGITSYWWKSPGTGAPLGLSLPTTIASLLHTHTLSLHG